MKIYNNLFEQIISVENLFSAWHAFKADKGKKLDVSRFEIHLEENIFEMRHKLAKRTYEHGEYTGFYIRDPKQRHIHKAIVRDRVLHHAVFSVINPIFEPTFIPTSFSCRIDYGTHRGVAALEKMIRKVSKNGTRPCFVLKCDIQKFFDSVDHQILLSIIEKRIKDGNAIWLLRSIIESYESAGPRERERERERERRNAGSLKGIPIGNLTSQLFANVYMNEFDQFMKHILRVKHYARYTDDFAIVSERREYLEGLLPIIETFLRDKLKLNLHPKKIILRPFYQGVDFLGYIIFPKYRLIRTKTKRRMFRKMEKQMEGYRRGEISKTTLEQSLQSYLGVLSHANAYRLQERIKNDFLFPLIVP